MEFSVLKKVEKLHIGTVLTDTAGGITGTVPTAIPGTAEAGFNTNSKVETYRADGGAYESATAEGDLDIALKVAGLPLGMLADLFGYLQNAITKVLTIGTPVAGDKFVQYRIQKANGAWRYVTILKSKLAFGEQKTSGEGTGFSDVSFSGNGVKTIFDGAYVRMMDDDDLPAGTTAADLANNWFTDIYWVPGAATLASIAITPTSNALAVGAAVQLVVTATFTPSGTTVVTPYAAYASSDVAKCTVSGAGVITGIAAGTATISVIYNGKIATKTITVS